MRQGADKHRRPYPIYVSPRLRLTRNVATEVVGKNFIMFKDTEDIDTLLTALRQYWTDKPRIKVLCTVSG